MMTNQSHLNLQQSEQSIKRMRRAMAARVLLSLLEADQLADPDQWTWDLIDALPTWCLQDEHARSRLQLVCGALVLAPELRLWIDREAILVAHELIGKQQFNHIVAKADSMPIAIDASAATLFKSMSSEASAVKDTIRITFLQAGASVMKATLKGDALTSIFAKVLGETAGQLSHPLANSILVQAEAVLDAYESTITADHVASVTQVQVSANVFQPAAVKLDEVHA